MIELVNVLAFSAGEIPLSDLWGSTLGFLAIAITTMGVIGMGSGSMTIAALSAFTFFAYVASTASIQVMTNVLYISIVVMCVGLGFKIIRMEAWGE